MSGVFQVLLRALLVVLAVASACFYLAPVQAVFLLLAVPFLVYQQSFLLGFMLVLASAFDPQLLVVFFLIYVSVNVSLNISKLKISSAVLPFLMIAFCWLVNDLYYGVNLQAYLDLGQQFLSKNFFFDIGFLAGIWHQSFLIFAALLIFLIFWSSRDLVDFKKFNKGLLVAVVCSQILTVAQIVCLADFFPNLITYWSKQERYAGTFTDPNAFGVMSFLLIAYLSALVFDSKQTLGAIVRSPRARYFIMFLILTQFVLALFSGSRSFLLGITIFLAILSYQKKPKLFYGLLGGLSLLLVFWNIFALSVPDYQQSISFLPEGTQRIASSLLVGNLAQTLFSRAVFFKLNLLMFLDSPLVGVGFSHFAENIQQFRSQVDPALAGWTDNSNSFFLGIASELGCLGLIAFALIACHVARVKDANSFLYAGILSFLVLLMIGPHLNFIEVAAFAGIILSQVWYLKPLRHQKIAAVFVLFALVVISVRSSQLSRGLYALEKSPNGSFYWTGSKVRFSAKCNQEIKFRSIHPDLALKPIQVVVDEKQYLLKDDSWKKYKAICNGSDSDMIDIELDRLWQPASQDPTSADRRWLGLQLVGVE